MNKTTLPGGLRVLTVPHDDTKAATVLVLVGVGSKHESKKLGGISHFVEHMLFKGTEKRPTPLAVAETMDRVGGSFNAFTGEDYTGYYAKVDSSHTGLAIEWVSDIFLNSLLPAGEVRRERGVIIEEIAMYREIPARRVQSLWQYLLYGDQPAGREIAGTRETVSLMTRRDLIGHMRSHYTAPNTIVCVAGAFDEKRIREQIGRLFRKVPAVSAPVRPPVEERQAAPEVLLETRDGEQAHLALGVRGVHRFHPARYAQEVLACMLGGMMSSRLFVEIRERMGIAYSVGTDAEADPDTGYVCTFAGIRPSGAERAIKAILREYRSMARMPVSAGELKKAKDHLVGHAILSMESSEAQAHFYGMRELLENAVVSPDEVYAMIQNVRAGEVRRLAEDIFRPERLNLALLGPFKSADPFRKMLKI